MPDQPIVPDLVLDERSLPAMSDRDLVDVIAHLKRLGEQASVIRYEAERTLAERMDTDTTEIENWRVQRSRSSKAEWDAERARSAAKQAIVQRLSIDPMTGELHKPLAHAVEQAVELAFSLTSTGAKSSLGVTGMKGLALSPDDFRRVEYGPWRIKLDEAGQ